ncbi:MAG: hypothetical protein QW597_05010 [Thermoplasmataceae archaeon]
MRTLPRDLIAGIIFAGIIILIIVDYYSRSILFATIGLLISVIGLWIGSEFFVDQAIFFGKRFKVSGKLVGLVLLSIGASIDEFILSLTAAFERYGEISLGNIQGSNIITFIVFIGIAPFILKRRREGFTVETLMLLILYITLICFTFSGLSSFYVGTILVAVFIIYIVASGKRVPGDYANVIAGRFSWLRSLFGIVLLFLASEQMVMVVNFFSTNLSLSLFTSGFIFAGITGSIPELFILLSAIRKRQSDMSIGVVYGSTIFKVSLVLGSAMMVTYVNLGPALYTYFIMLILILASGLSIFVFTRRSSMPDA